MTTTQINQSELPPLLAPLSGGFFMGLINLNGHPHALIRAPKALGHFTDVAWLDGEYTRLSGCNSVVDGLANTDAMAEAGSEVARQVRALRIGGHEDWHIPARDQLELMYRAGKPSARHNWCGWRDGDNPSSIPMGVLYTEESPAQTENTLFQSGGDESFEEAWYWSSTQYSANDAYDQGFNDGLQINTSKGGSARVFAVRMIQVVQ